MTVSLPNLGHDAAFVLLSYLLPCDTSRLQAVASASGRARGNGLEQLLEFSFSNRLWSLHLARDFHMKCTTTDASSHSFPLPPPVKGCETSKQLERNQYRPRDTYAAWHAAARELRLDMAKDEHRIPWPMLSIWLRLRRWAAEHAPQIAATLRGPLVVCESGSAAGGAFFEEFSGKQTENVSAMVRAFWAVCDGQSTFDPLVTDDRFDDPTHPQGYLGLFGGYAAYNHSVSMHFLPLHSVRMLTQNIWDDFPCIKARFPSCRVFAHSPGFAKFLLLDVCDGNVYSLQRARRRDSAALQPCVLGEPTSDGSPYEGEVASCPLLRWLTEFVERLEAGVYCVKALRPEIGLPSLGINLFPQCGPSYSRAVTRGVEVCASAIYMAECPRQGWTYSIRFRLQGTAEERGFQTCQLQSRRWIIAEEGAEPEHVEGDGVIGLFPLLNDAGWVVNQSSDPHGQYRHVGQQPAPFVYQSCSGRFRQGRRGTFGGEVLFVPGTIRKPTGAPFAVRVEPFPLEIGQFLY
ncbi:unnamed protein product [Polarella glacialis]|uniref:ApaG domain-containing protein n=1 Tax=Polarella glacialis TaxID=89957 RepID=A0A813EIT0_POLGL|nr:unnamed protein product [Polarella glacialis]